MSTEALKLFQYHEINHQASQTLFLLHGTGGSEHDLLPLVREIGNDYNLVGLRGNVNEGGMARFFARKSLGVFDQESIATETAKLHDFLHTWVERHPNQIYTFLGYSNGANMILATMFAYPNLIKKVVLLHPTLPFEPDEIDLSQTSVLLTYGTQDPLVSPQATPQLIELLQRKGAQVKVVKHAGGHEIKAVEVTALTAFLEPQA